MKPFEDYIDAEKRAEAASRARRKTREERRTRQRAILLAVSFACLTGVLVLAVVCVLTTRAQAEAQQEAPKIATVLPNIPVKDEDPEKQAFENQLIEEALLAKAHRIDGCTVTYYCSEKRPHICNAGYPYLTATGTEVVPGYTCAVDPSIIPYGSTVFVDYGDRELHTYLAEDCGGSIRGSHIDLATATHKEALALGIRTAMVYWIAQDQ